MEWGARRLWVLRNGLDDPAAEMTHLSDAGSSAPPKSEISVPCLSSVLPNPSCPQLFKSSSQRAMLCTSSVQTANGPPRPTAMFQCVLGTLLRLLLPGAAFPGPEWQTHARHLQSKCHLPNYSWLSPSFRTKWLRFNLYTLIKEIPNPYTVTFWKMDDY